MNVYDKKETFLGEWNTSVLNDLKVIVENGTFAHTEKMLHFQHCFQYLPATEASNGISIV